MYVPYHVYQTVQALIYLLMSRDQTRAPP